jgi:hypothetical protein
VEVYLHSDTHGCGFRVLNEFIESSTTKTVTVPVVPPCLVSVHLFVLCLYKQYCKIQLPFWNIKKTDPSQTVDDDSKHGCSDIWAVNYKQMVLFECPRHYL